MDCPIFSLEDFLLKRNFSKSAIANAIEFACRVFFEVEFQQKAFLPFFLHVSSSHIIEIAKPQRQILKDRNGARYCKFRKSVEINVCLSCLCMAKHLKRTWSDVNQ